MKELRTIGICALALACGAVATVLPVPARAAESAASAPKEGTIDFVRDVQPILVSNCYRCHGPVTSKGKLRLDQRDSTMKRDEADVVPGHADQSPLYQLVTEATADEVMPPKAKGDKLSASQIATLKKWIDEGAVWPDAAAQGPDPRKDHWAFKKPVRPPEPTVKDEAWPRNAIDRFVLAKLEHEGLHPSPEADRYSLIRRAALDLTGLPPTVEEADAFVKDGSPDAYEKLIDRLLASPAYGERWAQAWLDLARYADSKGYAEDNPRVIWKYRDWVIRAINDNKPFDRFTIEQLAGDLLPDPTHDQLVATAFNRNTLTNDEGGTDDEEFRTAAVVDRVNTTYQVWAGLTMGCSECHSHKFDPITQDEYFKTYAIFNQTEDADRREDTPLLEDYTHEQQGQRLKLQAEIKTLDAELKVLREEEKRAKDAVAKGKPETAASDSTASVAAGKPATKPARDAKLVETELAAVKKKLDEIKPIVTPIMRELPKDKGRKTQMFYRGSFLDKGPEIPEGGVPAFLPPLPKGEKPDRLALAKWLVSPDHPLTARVAVNRYWEQIFGIGIVETSEDFGVRCSPPSHPELLDWLATELIRLNWDTKALVREIVTSATYRQASKVSPELVERDPNNRLLARGPRVRASAEVIRDQALAASGLLVRDLYGPSVRPPQPKMGLSAAFGGTTDWQDSTGPDRYRRALYTSWRRSNPYPSAVTFDEPERSVCAVKRTRTNTPLQALVTLNDPAYVEAAQALGRRMLREGGETLESRITHGFRLCLTRPPEPAELERLVSLYHQANDRYAADPTAAKKLATEPIGPPPAGADVVDLAAWTVVGNVLLNTDEMFLKR